MDKALEVLLSFVKGDFAESLIRNMFKASGYNAYVYGEWKAVSTRGNASIAIGRNRTDHPDIRISNGGHDLHFLEVKFRARGYMDPGLYGDLLEQRSYWSKVHPMSVIMVNCWSRPYFNVVDLDSARLTSSAIVYQKTPLLSAGWRLDGRVYEKAERLVESCRTWGSE